KVIVLLAGTNNVGNATPTASADAKVADVTSGIQGILRIMQAKAPDATITLTAIFPRNDNPLVMPMINRINENLSQLADGQKIRYLNINDKLADKEGKLFDGMMNADKLHPALPGYQVWADALKPIFTELLGPPAREDHAPPPTGDPSRSRPAPTGATAVRPQPLAFTPFHANGIYDLREKAGWTVKPLAS